MGAACHACHSTELAATTAAPSATTASTAGPLPRRRRDRATRASLGIDGPRRHRPPLAVDETGVIHADHGVKAALSTSGTAPRRGACPSRQRLATRTRPRCIGLCRLLHFPLI